MKKIICAILSLAIVMALSATAFADSIDLSALTWEELLELKESLKAAVEHEEYEKAAVYRDKIHALEQTLRDRGEAGE